MKQGNKPYRLLQSTTPLLFSLFSIVSVLSGQSFPAGGACPLLEPTCATPVMTAIDVIAPSCTDTRDFNLRVEFTAGGKTTDPTAFDNHYWVMQLVTKDSCVYTTNPFTEGTTSGPTYITTTGNSLVFSLSPEDLIYVTGGVGCTSSSAPVHFGGLDSVYISVQQRCDGPDPGCSNYSVALGEAVPPAYDMIVSQSSFQSPLDSTYYGFCTDNRTINIDGLLNETNEFGLAWYGDDDVVGTSQHVYICIQDWNTIPVSENYVLELTDVATGSPFNQTVADTWSDAGDSIAISTEEVDGNVCYKITYSLNGDGSIPAAMNGKIKARAVGIACETVTNVTIDSSGLKYNSFKIGWASNMLTTNHKFKIRVYQGGTCNDPVTATDTATSRPNSDNTYILDFLVNANNANIASYLDKFEVRDTVGSAVSLTDSFSLDLALLGLDLQNCTCFQAFVYQVCDGVDNAPGTSTWSKGRNISTLCESCEDGVQNGDETGIDCGGSCDPCPEFICSAPTQLFADYITGTQAQINWSSVADASLYEAQYKLRSSSTWISVNTTNTRLTLASLIAGQLYEWRVRSFCTSFSEWTNSCTFVAGNPTSSSCLQTGTQPTCTDNIQNQGETGVDCGGPCTACPEFSCDTPTQIYADNILGDQARLNWTAVTGAVSYQVGIKLQSASLWSTRTASTNSLTVSNFAAGQVYEWRVRTYCGSTYSEWSVSCTFVGGNTSSSSCLQTGIQPTCTDNIQNQGETGVDCGGPCSPCPESSCEMPTTIFANNIVSNRVTLNWTAVSAAASYDIQIRLISNNSWYTFTSTQTSLELSGIVPGQVYEWKVRTNCGSTYSDWTSTCGFRGNSNTTSSCNNVVVPENTPTCSDNIQNGDETGVDCGGSCSPCPEVVSCAAPSSLYASDIASDRATLYWSASSDAVQYQVQIKLASAVSWYTFNTTSTNISIRGLGNGLLYEWKVRTYCGSDYSDWTSSCTFVAGNASSSSCVTTEGEQPTCYDNIQNQGETGVDCGGPCTACETCYDNIQNGDETGIDCGGSCAPCAVPENCAAPTGIYASAITRSSAQLNWDAVSGANTYSVQIKLSRNTQWYTFSTSVNYIIIRGIVNGIDYDWRVTAVCSSGSSSWSDTCTFTGGVATSGNCNTSIPEGELPTCTDNVQNGDETGVDCGGSCAPCPTCYDNIQNQGETGVDCGGPCTACPTCFDNIQNGDETGIDCGGSCSPCPETTGCDTPDGLYADDISRYSVRLNWNAIPTALRYYLRFRQQGSANWITYNTGLSTAGLRGVLLGVTYEWSVQALCGDGTYTDWSKICTFIGGDPFSGSCDTASKTAGNTTQGMQAYPNPASGSLNVDVSYPDETNLVLSIRNLNGMELIRKELTSGTETLNVNISSLNPGVYLVVVSNSRIRTVQRIVVN